MSHLLSDMELSASPPAEESPDAVLVAQSRQGDRDAFACIVRRYQSLLCSIAYNAVGNLALSEDLAQETFVIAWRQLPEMREPDKLRAWLCGIARNVAQNARRRQTREPTHAAEPLDTEAHHAQELPPSAQAVRREEEAILWHALEKIPELYREPLILYYRQHRSIEHVAVTLELNEDTVRQRLSRGRRLLHEEVLALIEGALARTTPGAAFTTGVMAALALMGASKAEAAGVAAITIAIAAKGTATKATGVAGFVGVFFGPLLGVFSAWQGALTGWRFVRSQPEAEESEPVSEKERADFAKWEVQNKEKNKQTRAEAMEKIRANWAGWFRVVLKPFLTMLVICGLVFGYLKVLPENRGDNPFYHAHIGFFDTILLILAVLLLASFFWFLRASWQYHREYVRPDFVRLQERARQPGYRRKLLVSGVAWLLIIGLVAGMLLVPLRYFASNPVLLVSAFVGLLMALPGLNRMMFRLVHWADPEFPSRPPSAVIEVEPREFRSSTTLLGLPVCHASFGRTASGRRKVARAWFACGSHAVGFVAIGGAAVGVIAIGPAAVGVVAIGGLAVGPLALGCLAIGYWAAGGIALGFMAAGGVALGWHMASGELALAHDVTANASTLSPHAHDLATRTTVAQERFFSHANHLAYGGFALMGLIAFVASSYQRRKQDTTALPRPPGFESRPPTAAAVLLLILVASLFACGIFAPEDWQPGWVTYLLFAAGSAAAFLYDVVASQALTAKSKWFASAAGIGKYFCYAALIFVLQSASEDYWIVVLAALVPLTGFLRFGPAERLGVNTPRRWKVAIEAMEFLALAACAGVLETHPGYFLLGLVLCFFGLRIAFADKYAVAEPVAQNPK